MDWLDWLTRFMRGFASVEERRRALDAGDVDAEWLRMRITYRPFACARCAVVIKDGETVWCRGTEIIHDGCRDPNTPVIIHCWRCARPNRLKRGIVGARCGNCRASLTGAMN